MSIALSWLARTTTFAPTVRVILVKLKPPGLESIRYYQEKNKKQNPSYEIGC